MRLEEHQPRRTTLVRAFQPVQRLNRLSKAGINKLQSELTLRDKEA